MLSSDKVTIKKRIYNFSGGKMQGESVSSESQKLNLAPVIPVCFF